MPFERHEPDDSQLRPLQEWLLAQLVEAHLSQPAQKRHPFRRFTILGGPHVIHHAGFSSLHSAPLAFDHYEQTKARGGEPVLRVDQEVCRYLDAQVFRQQCTAAYDKWVDANRQLWSARVERDLAGIGHLCREAMQSFATCMVERFEPLNVDTNQQHDVSRLLAVLRHRSAQLGSTEKPFLDALVAYWGTVSDLAQRQEHGGHREAEPLTHEDARRLVFQTAVVMFEVLRSLTRNIT